MSSSVLKRSSTQWPGGCAFTLIDLLVCLAVASVLAACVLTPLITRRQKARFAQCSANLQQVNRAVLSFCGDHSQRLPTIVPSQPGDLWWWYKEQVKQYAGLTGPSSSNDTVFACPNDRGYTDAKPFCHNSRFDFTSYVFNGVTLPELPSIAGWPLADIKKPRKTLLVMEWAAHGPLSWHKSKTGRENLPFYCDAQSVVGFVDGHVNFTKIYYDGFNAAYTRDPITGYEYQYSGN